MIDLNLFNFKSENGINGRKTHNKKKIIRHLSTHKESLAISEIAKVIDLSIPISTLLIRNLVKENYLIKQEKKTSENGRRPYTYSFNKNSLYVIGVEILSKFIQLSVFNIYLDNIHTSTDRSFVMSDDKECLDYITSFVENALIDSNINKKNIIGIGIGMREVVKDSCGELTHFFSEDSISLKKYLESKIKLSIIIDNDSRTIGVAEQTLGIAKGVDNVLVVKVSRTLGLSIIANNHKVRGSSGAAGSFNHTQFEKGNRLCECGKIGCLGTEIGGNALLKDLKSVINDNQNSLYFNKEEISNYKYHDILDAVLKGDELSLKLVHDQGYKLGKALGNIINLLDPELVIIGGEYVMLKDFFLNAVKTGVATTVLTNNTNHCDVKSTTLNRGLGAKAGACFVLKTCAMINF